MKTQRKLLEKIRYTIIIFIICLLASGLTAYPIRFEMQLLEKFIANSGFDGKLANWLNYVIEGVYETYETYGFIAYGTDWLAFAHIIIAIFFIGVYIDPVKNKWNVVTGIIACGLIIPQALISGAFREIPFQWGIIDSLFGIIGIIPLVLCYKWIVQLEKLKNSIN